MNLTLQFESAEERFKQILEDFFVSIYDEKSLVSHGLDHHRRVWSFAKELLPIYTGNKKISTIHLPEKLIIASYLHDIGMSVDHGIRHGIHSRDICIRFLNQYNYPLDDFSDVLSAIENHDNKNYSADTNVGALLTILSVADDLDAFGFIGIYRYAEIYLARGIRYNVLGNMIIENASRRFNNFINNAENNQTFIQIHKKRYLILENFFSRYNDQITFYSFGRKNPLGYCGVVEQINKIIKGNMSFHDLSVDRLNESSDQILTWFLKGLTSELFSI
jgi:HD superfamily phosphodiesterase